MSALVTSCIMFFGTVILITWLYLRLKKPRTHQVELIKLSREILPKRHNAVDKNLSGILADRKYISSELYIDPINYAQHNDLDPKIDMKGEALALANRFPYVHLDQMGGFNVLCPLGSVISLSCYLTVDDAYPYIVTYTVTLIGDDPAIVLSPEYVSRVKNGELEPYLIHSESMILCY